MERIADPVLRSEYGEHEKRRLEKHMERIEGYMRVGSYEQLEKATLIKILEERDSLIETQRKALEEINEVVHGFKEVRGYPTQQLSEIAEIIKRVTYKEG